MSKELQIFISVLVFCFIMALFNRLLDFDYGLISALTAIYWIILYIKHTDK